MVREQLRWRFAPLLVKLLFGRARPMGKKAVKSVVCLRPGKLGDMIVATPLFAALREQAGVERLAVVCSPANEIVIRHSTRVDEARPVNFHGTGAVLATIAWLRRQRFDAIVDLTPGFSRTNFLMSYYGGPRSMRAGIEKGAVAPCYHVHVGGRASHLADRMLDAGEALCGRRFEKRPGMELFTGQSDKESALRFVGSCQKPLVGVNLSAGNIGRQWGLDRYEALFKYLFQRNTGATFVLIGTGERQAWAEKFAAGHEGCVAAPALPFMTVTEIIGACSLFITPDTALVHAASAFGVPVVGLYNAHEENFTRWRPYRVASRVVRSSGTDTINDISPEEVCEKAFELMKEINL